MGRASAPHESSDNLNNINGLQFYHSIRGNLQNLPFCSKKRVAEEVEHDKKYTKPGVLLCLLCAAMLAACPGDRMSQSTTEVVDDSLIANKVTMALYSDTQVHGRGMRVESAQGVVALTGVVASAAEAQRAMQIAQQVKGVKAVHNRLRVQEGRPEPAPRTSSSSGKTRQ